MAWNLEELPKLFPDIRPADFRWACAQLRSVLDNQAELRFSHQSFVDFLINQSTNSKFHFDREHHKQRLTSACFSSMAQELDFNMGKIPTSYHRNDDIPGLLEKIPSHMLYSCQFWAAHLKNCGSSNFLGNRVMEFMESQLLYWLEVMSIGRMVGRACESLQALITWSVVCRFCFFG